MWTPRVSGPDRVMCNAMESPAELTELLRGQSSSFLPVAHVSDIESKYAPWLLNWSIANVNCLKRHVYTCELMARGHIQIGLKVKDATASRPFQITLRCMAVWEAACNGKGIHTAPCGCAKVDKVFGDGHWAEFIKRHPLPEPPPAPLPISAPAPPPTAPERTLPECCPDCPSRKALAELQSLLQHLRLVTDQILPSQSSQSSHVSETMKEAFSTSRTITAPPLPVPVSLAIEPEPQQKKSKKGGVCRYCGGEGASDLCIGDIKSLMGPDGKAAHEMDAEAIYQHLLIHRICKKPECKARGARPFIDYKNRQTYCMICRAVRARNGGGEMCGRCEGMERMMQANPTVHKEAFVTCMVALKCLVREVQDLVICQQGTHEVVTITDTQGRRHVFDIGFHHDTPHTHTEPEQETMIDDSAFQAFRIYHILVNVTDIEHPTMGRGLCYRLDALRRWVIFALRYGDRLPESESVHEWRMFFDYSISPSGQVKIIQGPPAGLVTPHEFATDVLAGHISIQAKGARGAVRPHMFSYVDRAKTDVRGLFPMLKF